MIRKFLCWLGFHEWENTYHCSCGGCAWRDDSGFIVCSNCDYQKRCKHCGKIKK